MWICRCRTVSTAICTHYDADRLVLVVVIYLSSSIRSNQPQPHMYICSTYWTSTLPAAIAYEIHTRCGCQLKYNTSKFSARFCKIVKWLMHTMVLASGAYLLISKSLLIFQVLVALLSSFNFSAQHVYLLFTGHFSLCIIEMHRSCNVYITTTPVQVLKHVNQSTLDAHYCNCFMLLF